MIGKKLKLNSLGIFNEIFFVYMQPIALICHVDESVDNFLR